MQGPQIYHPPSDFHYSELRVFALACCQSKLPVVEPMILVLNPALLVLTQQQALPTLFVFDRTRFLAVHDGNGMFSRDLFTVSSYFPFSSSLRRVSVSPAPAPETGLVALSTSFGAGSAT